ncbi:MAG TPA: NAD(+) diphosphatase [Thermoanaerobaculia bacterium]|jgi:NAD+ diphosphatase
MFDRAAHERVHAQELLDANARAIVSDGSAFAVHNDSLTTVAVDAEPLAFLGRLDGAPLFLLRGDPGAGAVDFRAAAAALARDQVEVLSLAKALLEWDARAKFCGACGTALTNARGGFVRSCAQCGMETFPRLDPAVIMLVTLGERALLARHHAYSNRWSTLAGFVEPGETLEAAVAREVLEETGVVAASVTYFGSQPWPLPSSLMVGFRVVAATAEIRVDPEELADARWFTREEIVEQNVPLSGPVSISRALIDAWLRYAGPSP